MEIKFLKEYKDVKVGEIVKANKKSADNFISQGYAELVKTDKVIKEKKPNKKRQIEAKLQQDIGVLERAGKKFTLKEAVSTLNVDPNNYEIFMLKKYGLDYLKEILADYLDITWVEVKKNLNIPIISNYLDIKEKDIKEIWKKEIADNKVTQKKWEEEIKEHNSPKEVDKGFIWNEKDLRECKIFPIDIIKDKFCYGLLLPKLVENVVGGKVIGKTQRRVPCLITSKKEFIEWTMRSEEDHNIIFSKIPSDLPYRWKLELIKDFLEGKAPKVEGKLLLNKITEQYKNYVFIMNEQWYKIQGLWDICTYLHPIFEALALIEQRGLPGTGKTKIMTISSYITFNGGQIMVNPSESTLFRWRDDVHGTLYIDEAEKLWKYNAATKTYEGDTRTELVNSSYTKEGTVPRIEKNEAGKFETKWYRPFGPTMLGSVNGLYGATETRAITRISVKSPNADARGEKEPSEDKSLPVWEEIRDMCYRFSLENWNGIKKVYNELKDSKLKKRDLQIWKPILSLAKYIDESLFLEIETFAKAMSEQKIEDSVPDTSFDYLVLKALRDMIEFNSKSKIIDENNPLHKKVYVNDIKIRYCGNISSSEGLHDRYLNRNISMHLDKLGFKEFRKRDHQSSYFELDKEIFDKIIGSTVPELAFDINKVVKANFKDESVAIVAIDVDDLSGGGVRDKKNNFEEKSIIDGKINEKQAPQPVTTDISTHLHTSTHTHNNNSVDSNVDKPVDNIKPQNMCSICPNTGVIVFENKTYCIKCFEELN